MKELVELNLKFAAVLVLGIMAFPSAQTVSIGVAFLVLAAGSIGVLFYVPAGAGGVEGAIRKMIVTFPDAFERPINLFETAFPWICLTLFGFFAARFLYHRYFAIRVRKFVDRFIRIRLDKKKPAVESKLAFRIEDFVARGPDGKSDYFIGLDGLGAPVRITQTDLTRNVQVVGPPGTGKSILLFNFAIQAIQKGKGVCFVDGKGDMSFLNMLQAYFGNDPVFKGFRFFTPLHPEMSHTYNPLISIEDPGELADMLANGLNLNVPGPGKVYSDTQKAYLLFLFNLFLATGKKFNFADLMTFTDYPDIREHVYGLVGNRQLIDDIEHFFKRLKANQPELLGLTTQIQKLFCADPVISSLVNTYASDIVIKDLFEKKQFCLFSLSAGKKAETNEALAKMVISDVANAVGERMARPAHENDFVQLILDEFGQYVPPSFDKFITTARGANVGCILSHQSNAQLVTREGVDRLAGIVRECSNTTVLFKQAEEADFWARVLGTRASLKRTDVIEKSEFFTEKKSEKGSLREVEEFLIHPNRLKTLEVGQVAFRIADQLGKLVSIGMFNLPKSLMMRLSPDHKPEAEGLNLRKVLESTRRVPLDTVQSNGDNKTTTAPTSKKRRTITLE